MLVSGCGGGHPSAGKAPASTATTAPSGAVGKQLDQAIQEENDGHAAQAVVDFLGVVKADPDDAIAWYDLGVIADRQDQKTQASGDYRRALHANPDYVPALYNLAILETPDQPGQAQGLYQRVIRLQASNAAAHLNLGFVLITLGQKTNARREFATAIRLEPDLAARIPKAWGGTG